ncbi:hypothetical protein [Halorubrum tailed virus BLv36]|nr:hypothetical protein [Halorubrum tailed virus BLv36]
MKTVTRIKCTNCSGEFDQNRDCLGDSHRCPLCGEKHTEKDETKIKLEELNNRRPRNANAKTNPTPKPKEYVYLIHSNAGHTKIGISMQPQQRKRSLQTGSAHDLELLATRQSQNPAELEKSLHDKYEKHHVRGEWFDIPKDKLNALVQRFKNE